MIKVIFDPENDLLMSEINGKKSMNLKISEGPSPLELLLISLGACAAITLYKSLVIRGGKVKSIEVTLMRPDTVDNRCDHVKEIMMEYSIVAGNITPNEAEEIAMSSLRNECTIAKILAQKMNYHLKVRFKKA
ncbi:MAG: OsmC family protein [Nitrososphaerota archaeon]